MRQTSFATKERPGVPSKQKNVSSAVDRQRFWEVTQMRQLEDVHAAAAGVEADGD